MPVIFFKIACPSKGSLPTFTTTSSYPSWRFQLARSMLQVRFGQNAS